MQSSHIIHVFADMATANQVATADLYSLGYMIVCVKINGRLQHESSNIRPLISEIVIQQLIYIILKDDT